jgi:hypothetical protein
MAKKIIVPSLSTPEKFTPITYAETKDGIQLSINPIEPKGITTNIPGFEKESFEGYLPESRIDPLSGIASMERERATNQAWGEQALRMVGQAANEAVMGTVQSLAAIGDIPSYMTLLKDSSKSDEDFHNAVYNWAKEIKDSINEEIPIYSGDRFDSGWFWENLGRTLGSAASFYIPGIGAAKVLGKLGEAVKLGTTAKGLVSTLGGAAAMRHAENFQEASNVYDITFKPAFEKFKSEGLTDEEAFNRATHIAGEAAAHDYKLNASNYAFDVLQLGAILRPKLPSFLKVFERQPYKVLKTANLLPDSKLGRFGKWIVDPAKGIFEAGSEGVEEVVNQVSQYESQRLADIRSGKIQDDESTFFERLPKYLGKAETIDSFIWGTVGGAAFKGLGLITGQDENKQITKNKIAELYSRNETIKAYSDQIANVVNGNKVTDESGRIIRDYSTYSDNLKQSTIETLNDDLAFNLGLNASRVGNTDLLIKQLEQPEFQEQLVSSGIATNEEIKDKIPDVKRQIELADYLYNKYTNKFFETPVEETVKSRLVEQSVSFEKQIADNNTKIDKLRKENSKILAEDPIIKANSYNPEFNQSISKAALRIAKVQIQNQIEEIKKDAEIKSDLQTVLIRLNQKEKQFPEIDVDEVTFSNFNLVNNQAQQELYNQFNTVINSKIIDLASKENIESTKAKIASDKKKAKEFVVDNKTTADNQDKQNRINETGAKLKTKQIAQVAYKIVDRKDPNEKLTPEEQQIYDNNTEVVEQLVSDIYNVRTEQGTTPEPPNIIVTEPEEQEHTTETNTGYTDPTYYDNYKDAGITVTINKAEDQLRKDQGSKTVDTESNIIIESDKISDGYQALAHLSREYELVKTPEGKKLYQPASDELIVKMDRIILSTEKLNPGEEVELFVNEDYKGDFYDPSIIDDNKAIIPWQSYLDNLKNKYSNTYKSSDEYVDNVPIGVRYNNRELHSTYYHQNSWINENKVASENIEEDRKNNKEIRKYLVENNTFKTNITSKGNGVLFRIKEYIPLNKATEDPNPTIAVVDKDQTFKLAKGSAEASYFQEQTINVKDLSPGTTVLLTEVNKGKYLAIPLKSSQIANSKYVKAVKDSIIQAITIYLDNDKTNQFALDILKTMKLDITSIEGLEDYITKFVNNYNTNKQDLQVLQKSGALPVATDVTIFNINKGNIAFKNFGTVYYIAKNLQVKRDLFFTQLDKALDKLYLGTNIDSLSKNESILLSGIEQPIDYKTFLMENLSSNIKGFKVDEVGLEKVPIYSYTIQKVVRLNFSKIISPKEYEGAEEAFGKFEEERREFPQPIIETKEQGLRSARKGDKGIFWTTIKGLRQDWETDKNVTVKAVSKYGVLFEEDESWHNFKDNWNHFKNLTLIQETTREVSSDEPQLTISFQIEDFSELPDLTTEQVSLLQKYAENISVPGLDIHKQIQLVNTLTNSVIETIQRVKDKDVKTPVIYNTWKEGLEKNRTILKNWLDVESNKVHSKYTGFQKMFNSIDAALNGWNTILRQAEQKVANIINKRIDPDQPLDLQEIQDSERFDYDKSADEKNPEDGVSARVKILLAGIEDVDKNGKSKKNWLGETELVDHRLVYNTFQQWTTDLLRPTFSDMLTSIKSHENEFNWVPNAIKKLEGILDQDQKAFVNDMLNNYTKFIKIMWDEKRSKGGFRVNLQYPSKLSTVDTLLDKWEANFINSNLVQVTEGNYTFNKELADKVVAEFRALQKQASISRNELKNWLSNFNIGLSDNTWRDLENGYFRINTKRIPFKNLLLNSYSPFVVLADSIDRLSENREIEDANPFDNTAVEKLAQFEAKYSENLYSQMVRTAGKSIYPFNKNTFISNRILDLVKGNKIEELKVLPYNRHAYWLNEGKDIFKANVTLASADLEVLRKHGDRTTADNELHNLSDSDYELVNMALIHASQEDKSGSNNRIISLLYPTQSDKTKAVIISGVPAFKVGFNTEGNVELETLNRVYNQLVLPEIERIIHFQKLVDSKTPINVSGLSEGWNKFYLIPSLNTLEDIFIEGKLNPDILISTTIKEKIIQKLDEVIIQLRDEKLNNWKSYDIIDQDSRPIYVDNKFIKEHSNDPFYPIRGIQLENHIAVSKALATDMVVQNLIGNANVAMTMVGDFANAYKSKSTNTIQQVKDTFNNIGKRLAGDIAPGSETEDNNTGTYKQAFVDDRALDSLNLGQYKFIIGEEESKEYTSKGILKEGTNAQEFTTVSEQLSRYYYEGVIDEDFYQTAIDEIRKQIEVNNHDYIDKVKKALIKVNPDYLGAFNELVLQVEKPVYVDNKIDPILQHEVRYYIKSSAYTLTLELTKGTDLDNVRIAMEKQGISRLAFSSAVKLGNFKNPISLWSNDGTIKTSDQIDFANSSVLLNRSGFRIQQIIPYDETKAEINRVSQASKNLFLNLYNVEGFEYQGKTYKGSELNDIYQKLYRQVFDIQKQDFVEEIGYDLKTDRFINTEQSIQKIKKIILDEANRRNYPINDIEGIQLDKSLKLLAFSSSSQKLESLLNSIVQNRVLKILHPGQSYVLSTEEGYQGKLEDIQKSGIVYTDSWTGELKSQRIVKKKVYNDSGTEELVDNKYYKNNQNDCLVLPAQALIPFPYKDNEGKPLDRSDFINSGTGKIDNKKLPKELRYTFGMRIPNSKLDSQSYVEAVGFIPKSSGDIMIATRDYLVQMSSDFDVDKLYNYMYSTYYDEKSGKLKRFTAKIKQKEEIDEIFEEEVVRPSSKKKDLLNSILDIHIAIHSNTSPEVQSQIFAPLGTWEFETIAKRIESDQKETRDFVGISDQYQKNVRLGNASDKLLVGIFANLNMFNSVAQGKDLKMVLGFTRGGKEIPFILNFGDKTSKGDLSGEYTIGDKKTFKSDIITALLQSAVDGAKLQILGKFNHNAQTAKIVNLLAQLGFKEEVALFTAQPIIKELIDTVKAGMSSTKPFTPDLTNKTINDLRTEIINTIPGFSGEAFNNQYGYGKALTIDNMWSAIKDGEENPEYKFIQLAALDQYEYLSPQADKLTSIMAAINTDSKGLSKNLLESIIKYNNVLKYVLSDRTTIINSDRLLKNTINGEATDILKLNNNIWRQILPYDLIGVQKYFNTILDILGKQELSIEKKADLQRQIFNEFKSYLFSKKELGLTDQDIQTERQRLFFGENSLANTISKLQKEEQWKNHPFIGKLYYEINKNGLPSIVKINAAQEDIVEQSTILGAYDLLIKNRKIEGTEYTTRSLMQDLTLAAYLSGGIQQAQQYLKYIPSAYLHTIPFADSLSRMIDKFDDMEFMQISNENSNIWELPSFIIQYFQHNSDRIKKIVTDKEGNLQGIKRLETKNKILEKFVLTDPEIIDTFPIFLTISTTGRKRGLSRNYLYIHQGELLEDKPVFTRIDNLGYTRFKEYNGNLANGVIAKSTIADNNTDNIVQVQYAENEHKGFSRVETNPLVDRTPSEIIELRPGGKEVISDILQNIVAEDSVNPYYKVIANVLNGNLDNLTELNLTTESVKGAGFYQGNRVNINPEANQNQTLNGIVRTLLHELIHSQTSGSIETFLTGKTKGLTKSQLVALTRLKNLWEKYKEIITNKEGEKYKSFEEAYTKYLFEIDYNINAKLHTTQETVSKYYPLKDMKEFVSMALTDENFQKVLNEIPFDNNKTWLQKVIEEIANLLGKLLGIDINKGSALEVALHDILNLLNTNTRTVVQEQTQLSELPEVATPVEQDRPKFQLVIDNLKQQQSKIYKVIAARTIDLKKVSGEEKINVKRVLKALNRQLEEIDLQIDKISKLTSVESILDHANSQLKDISNRLSQKTITENDMLYARNTINLWLEAGNFENGNIFFNDDEIEASKDEDSDLFKIRRDFILLRDYASQISDTWIKLREQYINNWLQTDYGKDFKVSVDEVIKDIGLGKSFLLDISKDDYLLVQAMYDWNAKASFETSRDTHQVMTGIKEVFEKIHKRYKKGQLYEMFSQAQSNTDKRKTGDLVFRYSQKYFDWKGNLWGQLKGKLKLANSIEDSNKRKAYIAKQWQEFNTEFKKNNLVIDIRKLLSDTSLYSKTFSVEEIEQHKKELISNLGFKGYEKQLERAKEKLEKYKLDREAELYDLTQRYSKDNAKIMAELQVWDYENSPYLYAEQWEEGFKQVINGRYISTNGYNSEIVPRRIVEGKDQGYYDSKFETIEKDTELLAVYDYLLSTIQELNGYFPGDIQGELQVNTLPKFEKGILESFSKGEMINGLKGIWDSFKELQREGIGSPVESTTSTDVYGEKIKDINTYWIQPNTKRIQDYVERQEIIHRQSNPKTTREQLYKLKKEWTKDIKDIIAKESTTDLEKIIKLYSIAAISYKHKAKIEDAMTLSNSFIRDLVKSKQNLSGESLKDQFGRMRKITKPAENLEKQLDHFMDTFYGDKTQAIELATKQKVYTNEEEKIKKELEETLAKGGLEESEVIALNKQLKDLGGYRTGGKLLDMMNQWVRLLGLAWNPFASINNAGIGYMCNITEASGGRVFTTEQLHKGYWEFLHNSGKTNAIMEDNSILIEIQSEISEKHKSTKWFEPFGLQHKTELLNQSPVMVAILLNRKVELNGKEITMYDAYDKKGKLKEGVKFPDENYEFKTFQLIKETIKDIHGNYDKDAPIRANRAVLGRSLLVFRKWMINAFYNRLGTEHFNLSKEMTDKGRWLSYGAYFKEYGVLLGTRDIALNLIKKLTFGLWKTNFDAKLNGVDAANMRKNLTELMFLGTVTALALMLKATSDDDEDKTKYLCFFWINQLMRLQTDVLFYVDPQQFKTILRDPIPFMVLVNNTQKAIGRGINLVAGGEDLYQQGAHKDQSKSAVAFKKIIPGASLIDRFKSMHLQIFSKSVLLQAVGNEENK